MKFGVCFDIREPLREHPRKSDYLEIAGTHIDSLTSDEFALIKNRVADKKIKPYSCNGLIDPSLRLTGPDVNLNAIQGYCDRLFYRLAELNVGILVFGSGKAKRVPDGFSIEKAWEQLFKIGDILASTAKQFGQAIAVEPLSYKEVNIINTVDEAAYYAKTVNRDNFKILVDFYHFDSNNDDFSSLQRNSALITHAHFAAQKTRTIPNSAEDWRFFEKCLRALWDIGYTGALSYEGKKPYAHELDNMILRMKDIEKGINT